MEHDSSADPIKVLLVEDNPGDARLTRMALSEAASARFNVTHVERLSEALQCLAEDEFDVVLLDLSLPDSHGMETFAHIHEQASQVSIIVLTGLTDEEMAIKSVQQGAQDYLSKNEVDTQRLVRAIRYAIERKRMGEALRESEKKFRMVFENAHDEILLVSNAGTVLDVNDRVADIFGYTPDDLIGMNVLELGVFRDEDIQILSNLFIEAVSSGDIIGQMELDALHKDGHRITVEVKTSLFRKRGEIEGVIVFIRDITNHKQAIESLRESEEKFRMLSEQSLMGIAILQDDVFKYANQAAADIYGYSAEEMLSWEPGEYGKLVHPADHAFVVNQARKKQSGDYDVVTNYEWRAITGNGETKWIDIYSGTVMFEGKPADLFSITDVTERKHAAEALHSKNEELRAVEEELREVNENLEGKVAERTVEIERLLKQKEGFISQLGHDLRSPLTPLMALCPILCEEETNPQKKELLDVIVSNVRYMKDLVEKTLELAKLNSADTMLEVEDIKLARIPDEICMRKQDFFAQNEVIVENRINESIVVAADRLRLTEVFDNLSSNATKFMPEGGILTFDAEEYGDFAIVAVRDTGIGLTGKQIDYIFDEFYKADQSRHDLDSSGLGLTICKRILEKHDGGIWAESEGLGKGTTFFFTVPLRIRTIEEGTMALDDLEEMEPKESMMNW